ncbi:3'-5' exoribonuclease domain-containing protein [Nocardiopsis protaetiae]|uniref:3'-5' exoribonuclease domain-containing protein n=1 Tax=Nocardiopsis protaetiae TaxID=3382270 RepID=UPI00387A99AB
MIHAYDLEFLEDGRTIELISIGIVAEDGREYYAVAEDAPWRRIKKDPWLMENVVRSLPHGAGDWKNHMPRSWVIDFADHRVKPKKAIATEVREFLLAGDTPPELWADYGAYDHVALCQLWGRMVDLPPGLPMFTRDLQQEADRRDLAVPEQESGLHNALADARHVMSVLRAWGIARTLSTA